jgi:hypothetical protein
MDARNAPNMGAGAGDPVVGPLVADTLAHEDELSSGEPRAGFFGGGGRLQ